MFGPTFRGLPCIPSHDALKDMARHDIHPSFVERIIEEGEDYANGMMGKGEVGRAIAREGFTVLVKLAPSYSRALDEDVWVIKHVGKRRLKR